VPLGESHLCNYLKGPPRWALQSECPATNNAAESCRAPGRSPRRLTRHQSFACRTHKPPDSVVAE
jgi:hypothetical protein